MCALKMDLYNALNYTCGYGVLNDLGAAAASIGKKAFIIASPKAFEAAGAKIIEQLDKAGIPWEKELFAGFSSESQARAYAAKVKEAGADFIIVAGGGRTLDTAKYAASFADVMLITVPTISATNASYRRNTMAYTDDGKYISGYKNKRSPMFVFADADILGKQPLRYLYSGIIDAMARWYESKPYRDIYPNHTHQRFAVDSAKIMYDYFTMNAEAITEAFSSGKPNDMVVETVTNIIGVCGVGANFMSDIVLQGFAHPFYNMVTNISKEHEKMHGEIIGYGVLLQMLLEQIPEAEVKSELKQLQKFGFDYSLRDIGIADESELDELCEQLWIKNVPSVTCFAGKVHSAADIKAAVLKVNQMVLEARK